MWTSPSSLQGFSEASEGESENGPSAAEGGESMQADQVVE
eukprot:CAMPEP_0195112900 /NCGR_PEP_ID=MMETSP0448-20130528/100587_1 /TAXON_ID=66468 /ORGANISM="Heterocapsa triquestra, Strain CCMP 448" /LENGTH=39 /DNA_ID= /DNA_START= /DNA_END= /DNA_ORIENTATION=